MQLSISKPPLLNPPMERAIRFLLTLLACGCLRAAEPFSVTDLLSLKRIADPEVSPDGKWVAYTLKEPRFNENKFISHIWVVSTDGGEPRQITSHEKGESRPKWSPDGKSIAFLSARGGSQQVWMMPIDGGEARQVTTLSTEADNHIWSPDGQSIAFTSDIWPDLSDDAAQKKRADEREASGVKAQVIDSLMYRHWTEWRHGKRTHIFITPITVNAPRDLTPGDFDAPPFSMSSSHLFDFAPDGKTLYFTRGTSRNKEAWSTDTALCSVSVEHGEITDLTPTNKGWDGPPYVSPDGHFVAYKSQPREGYEADKVRLALFDTTTKTMTYLANDLDRSIDEIVWTPDSKTIYFTAEERAQIALYSIQPRAGAKATFMSAFHHFGDLSIPQPGDSIIASLDSLTNAAEIVRISFPTNHTLFKHVTAVNQQVYETRALPSVEKFQYPGALGATIESFLLKPPSFDPARTYPCLLLIHGGPQSAWLDSFSYRWNMMAYAAHGYVVVAPNFHGSSSYGQAFQEEISGDWGGAAYEDVMKAADWAAAQPYIDKRRIGAAGASYGGYMIDWILGHTNRFACLVTHAGVFNLESEYGVTEELWFPEWEFKGPPWKNRALYDKFSPHRFAANFKTPTLVSHGEQDFRVPIDQGLQLFTTLKRQGIDSRLLYFPDEGHWILKLKNSRLFYDTVFDWLDRYLKTN
jgi:dipeptidyl aminopeptidase/acylaminoacyl peptidase